MVPSMWWLVAAYYAGAGAPVVLPTMIMTATFVAVRMTLAAAATTASVLYSAGTYAYDSIGGVAKATGPTCPLLGHNASLTTVQVLHTDYRDAGKP